MDWIYVALGLAILLLAGDALVKGAVNLSLRLGIPALIVSLTVVAFGTSAPELLVSVQAVLRDAPGIALGNVVGSNTANILLVLGIPAIMKGLSTGDYDSRHSYVLMLVVSVVFIALCAMGPLTWWHGLALLAMLAFMLGDQFRRAQAHRRAAGAAAAAVDPVEALEDDLEGLDPHMPMWKILLFLALGLVGLPLGADLLVDGSVRIARDFGISETVIGLTLVAIGTSAPELATTAMAALRNKADVALGNVIGSNVFNLAGILGITALIGPIPVDPEFFRIDLWVMLGASLLIAPFVFLRWNFTRPAGAVLTVAYLGYLSILLM
ncbi:sodium:proton exchanger [Meridianimarinicoccus roseus]|uniref:Sodium:proton exchanger n=1 Tax=Meridianimarinicoccus roseus TaxID=2072018 RepID=A0A2V2LMF5_9RHOB|nr:calcium/sodium antiporter [Meridianimarinicoccus roseus]PWR04396.1 sodium:proton exchanger [Meridianimarinicoccus roseus]